MSRIFLIRWIVFTSDNGFFLGEHGLSGKWLMHEESIRVPLIIRYPKLPARMKGRRLGQMALNIDLSPTLLELAGLAIPPGTDGRSLKPLLTGERLDWRQDFFYEHHFDYGGRIPRTEGLRTVDWKYITYFDVEPPFEELYDLRRDPLEESNLATDPPRLGDSASRSNSNARLVLLPLPFTKERSRGEGLLGLHGHGSANRRAGHELPVRGLGLSRWSCLGPAGNS